MPTREKNKAKGSDGDEMGSSQQKNISLKDVAASLKLSPTTVSVVLKRATGKQCIINNSRQATYGYDQRLEALGSGGMLVSENRRPHMTSLHGADFTGKAAPLLNFFIDRYAEAFMSEIGAFVDAIETGKKPEVGFEDGHAALVLAEAAIRSAAERRTVSISEIG